MQKLLSLPPNLVSAFYELENVDRTEWFCTSDPVGMKLGSGGGTTWLLREWYRNQKIEHSTEKRILLIFVEQLYRAMNILNGGPYHHE